MSVLPNNEVKDDAPGADAEAQGDGRPRQLRGLARGLVVAVALLAVSVAVCVRLAPRRADPTTFGMMDFWRYHVPTAFFLDNRLHEGEFPLWNPLVLCGTPFAANPQTAVFYPLNLARSILTFNPTPLRTYVSLVALDVVHTIIAGLGMYVYGRRRRLSVAASLAGAFVFVLNACYVLEVMASWPVLATAIWLPWLALLFERACDEKTTGARIRGAVAAGMIFGVSSLGGFTQDTVYIGLTVGCLVALNRAFRGGAPQGDAQGWAQAVRGDAAVLAVAGVVTILCASAMLLPAAEFAPMTDRSGGAGWREPTLIHMGVLEYFENLLRYPGESALTGFQSAGIGAVLLAIAAALHRDRRAVAVFAALTYVLLDCNAGPPMPVASLLNAIVPFSMGLSRRAFLIAAFPLGILAGYGIDAVTSAGLDGRWRLARSLGILGTGVVLTAPLALWLLDGPFMPVTSAVAVAPVLLASALGAACWAPRPWFRPLLTGLLLAELLIWVWYYEPYALSINPYFGQFSALTQNPRFPLDNRRGVAPAPNTDMNALRPVMNAYEPLYLAVVRRVLAPESENDGYHRTIFAADCTARNARAHLMLKRRFWLLREPVNAPLPPPDSLYASATTVFIGDGSAPRRSAGSIPCVSDAAKAIPLDVSLAESRALDLSDAAEVTQKAKKSYACGYRVTFAAREMATVQKVLRLACSGHGKAVFCPSFRDEETGIVEDGLVREAELTPEGGPSVVEIPMPDFRRVRISVVVAYGRETDEARLDGAEVICDFADENDRITVLEAGANGATVRVRTPDGPRVLLFTEAYYPGWEARIDGAPVEIERANEVFQAVRVPSGEHRVEFAFRPRRVYAGVGLSLSAFVLGGLVVGLGGRRGTSV